MKKRWLFVVGGAAAVAAVLLYNPKFPPGCNSPATKNLAIKILKGQLGVQGAISLSQVRVKSGSWLAQKWSCEAQVSGVEGYLSRVPALQVLYTSSVTQDTGRQYVTARLAL